MTNEYAGQLISKDDAIELVEKFIYFAARNRDMSANRALNSVQANLRVMEPVVSTVHTASWILAESPYIEHEERVDGESHPRYICSHCGFEAGFECDPNGFAGDQILSNFCGGCGYNMTEENNVAVREEV